MKSHIMSTIQPNFVHARVIILIIKEIKDVIIWTRPRSIPNLVITELLPIEMKIIQILQQKL